MRTTAELEKLAKARQEDREKQFSFLLAGLVVVSAASTPSPSFN